MTVARNNARSELNALLLELSHYQTLAGSVDEGVAYLNEVKALMMTWYIEQYCEQWGLTNPVIVE